MDTEPAYEILRLAQVQSARVAKANIYVTLDRVYGIKASALVVMAEIDDHVPMLSLMDVLVDGKSMQHPSSSARAEAMEVLNNELSEHISHLNDDADDVWAGEVTVYFV